MDLVAQVRPPGAIEEHRVGYVVRSPDDELPMCQWLSETDEDGEQSPEESLGNAVGALVAVGDCPYPPYQPSNREERVCLLQAGWLVLRQMCHRY